MARYEFTSSSVNCMLLICDLLLGFARSSSMIFASHRSAAAFEIFFCSAGSGPERPDEIMTACAIMIAQRITVTARRRKGRLSGRLSNDFEGPAPARFGKEIKYDIGKLLNPVD
jgi:hypothetical protein